MTPTLIVTRPAPRAAGFARDLQAAWGGPLHVVMSPLMRIVDLSPQVPQADALILTSVNGVAAAERLGLPPGLTAWCVGEATAKAAQEAGFAPRVGPGDAKGLLADLITAQPAGRFAHIRGKHTRGQIAAHLREAGIPCLDILAYDQEACAPTDEARAALKGKSPVIVPLFSPRTGVIFAGNGPYQADVHAVAISDAVKDALGGLRLASLSVAATPDAPAMLKATLAVLQKVTPQH